MHQKVRHLGQNCQNGAKIGFLFAKKFTDLKKKYIAAGCDYNQLCHHHHEHHHHHHQVEATVKEVQRKRKQEAHNSIQGFMNQNFNM